MNKKNVYEKASEQYFFLTGEAIDRTAEVVTTYLQKLKYTKKNIIMLRLTIEEALLNWRDKFGEKVCFRLKSGVRFMQPYLMLEIAGEECNPLVPTQDDTSDWSQHLLSGFGLQPAYTYSHGKNQVRFDLQRRRINPMLMILTSIIAAVLIGALGRLLLPEGFRTVMTTSVLSMISGSFYGLLRMISGAIIFFSIVTGICGIGDVAAFSKLGKKVMTSFCGITLMAAVLCGAVLPFIFPVSFKGNTATTTELSSVLQMVFDIFPDNMLSPFITGNALQIIVLALGIGIALLILGKKASGIFELTNVMNSVINKIMWWICYALPVLIFVSVLENIWSDSGVLIKTAWQPFLVATLLNIAFVLVYLLYAAFRLKIKPLLLIKKVLPVFLIGITTASSSAAIGEMLHSCESRLGVKKKLFGFSVPMGVIICMGGCSVELMTCSLYSMKAYNIETSVTAIIIAIITVTMVAIATPPVPGPMIIGYTIMFTQLGIPAEAMTLMLMLSVFLDYIDTAASITVIPAAIAVQADKLKMIDRNVLISDTERNKEQNG